MEILTNQTIIIQESQAGQRLDKFLAATFSNYSRSFFQNLIAQGHITINGIQAKANSVLKAQDSISITMPEKKSRPLYNPISTDLGIEIVFTHKHFFIIYKPAGLLVHQTEATTTQPTVVDWLLSSDAQIADVGSIERPGIVHRLDKETSGLMILARTNYAHKIFNDLFKARTIKKTYVAIVQGHPPSTGTIDLAIARHPTNRKKMATFAGQDLSMTSSRRIKIPTNTRHAVTHYTVKHYFDNYALVEVQPLTGRTHQIRVHFAAIGHPLIGDTLYGLPSKLINRHALHAASLSFDFDGESFNFIKEIPEDIKRLLSYMSDY